MISIHLGVGAVLDEIGRLGAGRHLRAHRTAVAGEARGGRLGRACRGDWIGIDIGGSDFLLRRAMTGLVLAVAEPGDGDNDGKHEDVFQAVPNFKCKGCYDKT